MIITQDELVGSLCTKLALVGSRVETLMDIK